MSSPPKDRRFLAYCEIWHYIDYRYRHTGYKWKEVWWGPKLIEKGNEFREWCGDKRTSSTSKPKFEKWAELPKEIFNV